MKKFIDALENYFHLNFLASLSSALWISEYFDKSFFNIVYLFIDLDLYFTNFTWSCVFHFQTINRTVLSWLKQWDYVVFGKEVKQQKKRDIDSKQTGFKKKIPQINLELDKLNRPIQKVTKCKTWYIHVAIRLFEPVMIVEWFDIAHIHTHIHF